MDQIIVGIADCRIAEKTGQTLTTYALGSCIGLVVYDPVATVGGLLHFMLPDSAIDERLGRDHPYMFADTGIPKLVDLVCERGASRRRLMVHAAGGAQMISQDGAFEIGKRNALAMRKYLWKAGLLLGTEAVGGSHSRSLGLEIGSGRVWLQEGGVRRDLKPALARIGVK